jgi:DNA-binding MarR family transcriptional regulator
VGGNSACRSRKCRPCRGFLLMTRPVSHRFPFPSFRASAAGYAVTSLRDSRRHAISHCRISRRIGISILERYNGGAMARSMNSGEFRALAEFRYQIRQFLYGSEQAARAAGLEPQQYLFLLALRGLPAGRESTIRELAERMQLRHHSVVELVNRLERQQLLRRERSRTDRRQVLLCLTPRGEKILSRLARQRIAELRTAAPALVRALTAVIRSTRAKTSSRPRMAGREPSAQ